MAAHGAPEYSVAEGNDYQAHERTYEGFLTLVKWGLISLSPAWLIFWSNSRISDSLMASRLELWGRRVWEAL
jgi:Bacterial aa3 type cytochrome c oxidase subunit IV